MAGSVVVVEAGVDVSDDAESVVVLAADELVALICVAAAAPSPAEREAILAMGRLIAEQSR